MFMHSPPSDEVLAALDGWLDYLVKTKVLTHDYMLYGLCQVNEIMNYSPGAAFLKEIEQMFPDHWVGEIYS